MTKTLAPVTVISGLTRLCLMGALAFVWAGCGPNEASTISKPVVVYTSVDRIFAEPVLQRVEQKLNIRILGLYDTEETKSSGLVNRLIAKKDNPDGDLFWSGDPGRAALLKLKGITSAYEGDAARDIPEAYQDPDRHWIGFSARTRVLLVNNDLVPPGEEPKTIAELTKPKWKGRVAIANPLFGTTSFHVAALVQAAGEKEAFQWLDDLKANKALVVSSNGEVKRQVASGLAAVGLTDSDDAAEAISDGQPVRFVLLDQTQESPPPLGNLVIPNTISLIRGGPNPDGAKRVFDYLLSSEIQLMLADSCAQAPLLPGVQAPPNVVKLDGTVPMKVDYATSAAIMEKIAPKLKEWVDQK